MKDSQSKQNRIVALNYAYWAPPVGRSPWCKFARDGELRGVKAMTVYPGRQVNRAALGLRRGLALFASRSLRRRESFRRRSNLNSKDNPAACRGPY
jgi:hypothetical protein